MKKTAPTKSEIALLEPFAGLTLERIHVPTSREAFASATAEIKAAGIVGFDTESKPTFVTGDVSEGPHVVQFALHDKAYLFQLHRADGRAYLIELLQLEQVIKVGFGLKSDRGHIYAKLGVHFNAVVDLNTVFRMDGYHKEMGVRAAVGLVFKQRFAKARHVTTSNWSQPQLTPQQLLYAANDAYAALKVLETLNLCREDLPIMGSNPVASGGELGGLRGRTRRPQGENSETSGTKPD
ncbi:MAG TPA: 3'-5' exonuclease [Gallionella sp.]|nr:3'-5' exonuclease [Gallionella sp.]